MTSTAIKHRQVANKLIKHKGDRVKAYKEVYTDCKSDNAARVAMSKIMKSDPSIQEHIEVVLRGQGIKEERLSKKLNKLIDAKKEYYDNKGRLRIVTDNNVQLDAVKTGFKLFGHLQSGGNSYTDARSVNISHAPDYNTEKVGQLVQDIAALNAQLSLADTQTGELVDIDGYREGTAE